jgi:hypothetical protein
MFCIWSFASFAYFVYFTLLHFVDEPYQFLGAAYKNLRYGVCTTDVAKNKFQYSEKE